MKVFIIIALCLFFVGNFLFKGLAYGYMKKDIPIKYSKEFLLNSFIVWYGIDVAALVVSIVFVVRL